MNRQIAGIALAALVFATAIWATGQRQRQLSEFPKPPESVKIRWYIHPLYDRAAPADQTGTWQNIPIRFHAVSSDGTEAYQTVVLTVRTCEHTGKHPISQTSYDEPSEFWRQYFETGEIHK